MGFSRFAMYMLLFHCEATGGALRTHPLETSDVGWFSLDALPHPTAGIAWWGPVAAAAMADRGLRATFDAPREPVWRKDT